MSTRAVLVVAHLPKASPRILGLARYLPAHGWRPVVVTPCSAAVQAASRMARTCM